jgi:hypothetical protein
MLAVGLEGRRPLRVARRKKAPIGDPHQKHGRFDSGHELAEAVAGNAGPRVHQLLGIGGQVVADDEQLGAIGLHLLVQTHQRVALGPQGFDVASEAEEGRASLLGPSGRGGRSQKLKRTRFGRRGIPHWSSPSSM